MLTGELGLLDEAHGFVPCSTFPNRAGGMHNRHRGEPAMPSVKLDQGGEIHVGTPSP
jgi:hypothetical protein